MPSIEEILADLEASETEEPAGQEDETPAGTSESSAIKAIRDSQKSWEKKARELGKELKAAHAQITEFTTTKRTETAYGVFDQLELPKAQADLFLKNHEGDVTADAIRQFVTDYGLKDLSAETGGTTEEKSEGFQPGGTGSGTAEPKVYSLDEAKTLAGSDPARLESLISSGRVSLDTLPGNRK